jgi:hypothetical protein
VGGRIGGREQGSHLVLVEPGAKPDAGPVGGVGSSRSQGIEYTGPGPLFREDRRETSARSREVGEAGRPSWLSPLPMKPKRSPRLSASRTKFPGTAL